jgi:hypothetical protein
MMAISPVDGKSSSYQALPALCRAAVNRDKYHYLTISYKRFMMLSIVKITLGTACL